MVGVVRGFDPAWLADALAYVVGVVAVITLIQASRIYMLGPMRVTYALATNRQIPSAIGRLHRQYGTPYVAAIGRRDRLQRARAARRPRAADRDLRLRSAADVLDRQPFDHPPALHGAGGDARVSRAVLDPVGKGSLPIPSVIALVGSVAAFVGVLVLRHTATIVGVIWLTLGITLYVHVPQDAGQAAARSA